MVLSAPFPVQNTSKASTTEAKESALLTSGAASVWESFVQRKTHCQSVRFYRGSNLSAALM